MKRILFILLIAVVSFSGCTKDTEDVRTQSVGTFRGSATGVIKYSSIPSLNKSDANFSITATLTVELDASSSSGLLFKDITNGGSVAFKATGVNEASNGFTFNIPSQTAVSTDSEKISGTYTYNLGDLKFDGGYISATKKLTIGINTEVLLPGTSTRVPMVMLYEITKQ